MLRFAGASLLLLLLLSPAGSSLAEGLPAPAAQKTIAVTIDDLPINGPDRGLAAVKSINDRLTAILKSEGIPAVGFVNEAKLYRDGEVDGRIANLKVWLEAGL